MNSAFRYIGALLLCLLLAGSLSSCKGDDPSSDRKGATAATTAVSTFRGDWPSNDFTASLPVPNAGTLAKADVEGGVFTAVLEDATLDDAKAYAELVKAAGFTVDPLTEEETLMGILVYTYTASNDAGMECEVGYLMDTFTIIASRAA